MAGGGVNAFEGTGLAGGDSALSSGGGVNSFLYGKSRGRGPVKKNNQSYIWHFQNNPHGSDLMSNLFNGTFNIIVK